MALKAGRLSKVFVWILMGLLLVGLAGFGATNLSGTARSVGAVGDQDIGVDAYARAMQQELRALQAERGGAVSFAEAQQMGLDTRVLSQLVLTRALDWEAERVGISVDDDLVANELAQIGSFQGPDGQFNRESYRFALENAGLTEGEFEEDLRDEVSRTVLQAGVLTGLDMPTAYADTIVAFAGERRDLSYAVLTGADLATGIPAPSEDELRAFYEANIDDYTRPETKRVTYAWVTPEMLLDSVEVPEETLREAYEEQSDRFNMPERRLVERLVFSDEAAAEEAAGRISAGETSFEEVVEARGLALADADLGEVTRRDLGEAAEPVFTAETGSVVGPAPSPLGPALFRVNAELAAVETPFEEAVPMLRDTLVLDRARRVIESQAESYDNELAGGATLEELTQGSEMQLGQIDWTPRTDEEIAAYPAFNAAVRGAEPGDYPEIAELGDGGVFALRVDGIDEPAPIPFEEVQNAVETAWEEAQVTEGLEALAEDHVAALADGASFEELGLNARELTALDRNARRDALPRGAIQAAFETEEGGATYASGAGRVAVLRTDRVLPADMQDEDANRLRQRLNQQAQGALAEDLFRALSADIQSRAGVTINRDTLNAVNSNLQ
ncbi:SurA N-terminal domain-containing protein [Roseivivax sp. GX 12232]|uniref:peptidylprolyl isomerase n=1 Tax=Roseivivax sp. GX 12232 TaxID=2900547 RepID=UPI001E3E2812|nr:peptidylprolyl isomerase [Roseivivax sp. GX 12232]MCE0504881.1 SurA N-terminal domain-containing protein [Roseivivax sp. GX 12232]